LAGKWRIIFSLELPTVRRQSDGKTREFHAVVRQSCNLPPAWLPGIREGWCTVLPGGGIYGPTEPDDFRSSFRLSS
jgi:hypothetical protein